MAKTQEKFSNTREKDWKLLVNAFLFTFYFSFFLCQPNLVSKRIRKSLEVLTRPVILPLTRRQYVWRAFIGSKTHTLWKVDITRVGDARQLLMDTLWELPIAQHRQPQCTGVMVAAYAPTRAFHTFAYLRLDRLLCCISSLNVVNIIYWIFIGLHNLLVTSGFWRNACSASTRGCYTRSKFQI